MSTSYHADDRARAIVKEIADNVSVLRAAFLGQPTVAQLLGKA